MIDTICLLIPKDQMIYDNDISSWELYSKTEQYTKFVRNPSKTEKDTGKYFPRLTGYNRNYGRDANVRIEFSIPKLLFLNNLDELEDTDFLTVIETLQTRLATMGVKVFKTILENASVSSIHFSKNILLQDGYRASHLISEMNKVNLRKSFDFTKTRFINDGQSLYAYTTSHQLVIYDKIADLKKGKKRAIDKDQTTFQKNLFDQISESKKLHEVIRFEIRINRKQKLNQLLGSLGYTKNPTFKEIFKTEISRKVVTHYWEKLIKTTNLGVFSITRSIKDILHSILLAKTTIKPKTAIYMLGLAILSKDENGIRQLRTILSERSTPRTWYRIASEIDHVNNIINRNNVRDWVNQIDNALAECKPYKIDHYDKEIVKPQNNSSRHPNTPKGIYTDLSIA